MSKNWLGLESTIYRTQGEHANHNTTDVVNSKYITNTDKPNENVQIIYYQLFFCLFGLLRYCFLFRCTHIQTALHSKPIKSLKKKKELDSEISLMKFSVLQYKCSEWVIVV
jgi:hypothetical protein